MQPNWTHAQVPRQQAISLGELLVGTGIAIFAIWGAAELFGSDASPQRTCGICGGSGHDRRTCPYDGERLNFSRSIPKSGRCECCGSPRYGTQRHHTRGRSNLADFLDVCLGCHIDCCHDGHFQNLGRKLHTCKLTGKRSHWRN